MSKYFVQHHLNLSAKYISASAVLYAKNLMTLPKQLCQFRKHGFWSHGAMKMSLSKYKLSISSFSRLRPYFPILFSLHSLLWLLQDMVQGMVPPEKWKLNMKVGNHKVFWHGCICQCTFQHSQCERKSQRVKIISSFWKQLTASFQIWDLSFNTLRRY